MKQACQEVPAPSRLSSRIFLRGSLRSSLLGYVVPGVGALRGEAFGCPKSGSFRTLILSPGPLDILSGYWVSPLGFSLGPASPDMGSDTLGGEQGV